MTPGCRASILILCLTALCLAPTGLVAADEAPPGYVLHEWGTFTSFSGSDGVLLEFSTEAGDDLPAFVYTLPELESQQQDARTQANLYQVKAPSTLQRMETPVIYFYADQPLEVDVAVRFPQGLLTELYPRTRRHNPATQLEGGFLDWGRIRIIPPHHPEVASVELPGLGPADDPALAEHYLYARETKSALVRVCPELAASGLPQELEKFLFYRGVGNFPLPLVVEARGGGELMLESVPFEGNRHPIPGAVVLEVSQDLQTARLLEVQGSIEAAQRVSLPDTMRPVGEVTEELTRVLHRRLVEAGLYEDEARAMVKTWKSSYFTEPGLRVLYLVPEPVVEALLPLEVSPAPTESVRVLLGRAEVLTPEREAAIEARLLDLGARELADREAATDFLRTQGRYAQAQLERVLAVSRDPEVRARARRLLELLDPKQ